ncbi:MAG: prephenate dehydratase, partial [Deltaproteobacteria bacterium]
RFLVIGQHETRKTENDKTSIMFATAHIPGALYKALEPMNEAGINMVKLESRPAKHENWNYFFFIDFQGHKDDPVVKKTMAKMKGLCLYLKHLGSYPMAKP